MHSFFQYDFLSIYGDIQDLYIDVDSLTFNMKSSASLIRSLGKRFVRTKQVNAARLGEMGLLCHTAHTICRKHVPQESQPPDPLAKLPLQEADGS